MEDNQIINLYFQRSENAIAQTDAKYGRFCLHIAERILANREDSEEAVNDTYLAAWNAIPPNRPPVLQAFLGRITRQLSIDRWRGKNTAKRGRDAVTLCLEELESTVSGETNPEQEMLQKEIVAALNRFLMNLPAPERNVFVCRYWYMDSIAEIAQAFGFTRTKVTTMLYRTRQRLRNQLEKEGLL